MVLLWRTDRAMDALCVPTTGPGAWEGEEAWPSLTVVIAARDEAANIEAALESLLAQDYPGLQVVAVNDRSTDDTGPILSRLAARHPRLTVLHVTALPPGWLGKNHACWLGAREATGEFLLLTDADVHFAPGALRAAMAYVQQHRLGHLVAAPRLEAQSALECAFLGTFTLYFALRFRLWSLRKAGSAGYVGAGAFNLVRRTDYLRVGGHRRLALEVVEDVKLGLLLRRNRVPQGFVDSAGLVSVRWYAGFWASLRGLQKNLFAATDYRWRAVAAGVVVPTVLTLGPWVALLGAEPAWVRVAALPGVVLPTAVHMAIMRRARGGWGLAGLAYPATHLALAGATLASAFNQTRRGKIVWRETAYSLQQLRDATLRETDLPTSGAVGW